MSVSDPKYYLVYCARDCQWQVKRTFNHDIVAAFSGTSDVVRERAEKWMKENL